MSKLSWEDITGGAKSSPAPAGNAEVISELPAAGGGDEDFSLAKANAWLGEMREFIKNIDDFAGLFLQLRAAQEGQGFNAAMLGMLPQDNTSMLGQGASPVEDRKMSKEGAPSPEPAPGPAASPLPGQPNADQIQKLMNKIIEKEGDIPLSKLLSGIVNQEPWLLKYALEMRNEA